MISVVAAQAVMTVLGLVFYLLTGVNASRTRRYQEAAQRAAVAAGDLLVQANIIRAQQSIPPPPRQPQRNP